MPRPALSALRSLPSVDQLIRGAGTALLAAAPRPLVLAALRAVLEDCRATVRTGADVDTSEAALVARARAWLGAIAAPRLRRVVNASGVVLHTNLGRAVLAEPAVAALLEAARGPCNLEIDLVSGRRGERDAHIEEHLCALSGAAAACAVNNNAAAVLLALNTLAEGREVVVSRGELVEIGGSFRIPDILAKSGARLREVGTTNRTHARDYEQAIGAQTALLLKVHPSNYRIDGFTADVSLAELVEIGRRRGVAVMEDLGSGALIDLEPYGLPAEPVVAARVALGADVVTFSGDKLLGGPQAGLLVGSRAAIAAVARNPLKRALRCDKLTLAALEATLCLYRTSPDLAAALPTLRLLTRPLNELEDLGARAVALLGAALGDEYRVELVAAESQVGSGAQPTHTLATRAVVVSHPRIDAQEIAARFRAAQPAVIGRVHQDRFWLDLRCVEAAESLLPAGTGAASATPPASRPSSS
jgi:L-seryl-tRNA(Ser) seleniumtransferase